MSIQKRTFALYLSMTPGLGEASLTRILTRNELLSRSPEQFLSLSAESFREEYRLSPRAIESLQTPSRIRLPEVLQLESRLSGLGVTWVTLGDAHYPSSIESMNPKPPGILYLFGNLKLLNSKTFCVLASRNSMPADFDLVEKLTEEAILNGEVLVTGQNTDVYQRSAVVPLRWGSPRLICLDRGLFRVLGEDLKTELFPAARLWRYEFDPSTDLVVSPFRPNDNFVGENNQKRDLLVGCLSDRLDFVSVAEGGNMQKLARLALKSGRRVRVSDRVVGYRDFERRGSEVIPS